ncbi:MAG: hypothetical protein GY731_07880, partial [Gammaproteobacteria bacterium]|nr:hypothetical protein [Gammaproteobacteria bacterium]
DGGVLGQLIQILATQLDMDESDLDGFTSLQEYGLDDRVVATEFCGIINNRWNVAFNSVNLKVDDDLNHLASQLAKLPLVAQAMEQQAALQPQYSTDSLMGPLCYWLLNRLNEVLGEDTNLDPQSDIRDFGMDSIALTSYAERIDGQIDIHFDPALLMQLNTIEEIAEYLLKRSSKAVMELPGITGGMLSSEPAPTTPLSEEADLQPQVSVASQAATLFESPTKQEEIVIVGISGRFPGADNLDEYWSNLLEQRDCVSEIPLRRWDWRKYYTAPGEAREGTVSKWSGLLDEIDRFDAEFFDISAHEAELMDPQQRLLLEESWHAIEDAGYRPSSFAGSRTGVFVGVCNEDYSELVQHSESAQDAFASTGEYFAIIPNRISYQFDLRGPSYAFDAACSSSLVAFYNAIQAIRNQDCDHALVGGVNICLSPRRYVYFSQAGLLSPQGRCKTFDEGADGYVRGEGVGVALLKRRSQAEADGDRIYAVIKDVAINHGGTANALTAPNPKAQATLIADAYRRADVSPESVGYIEVHGTGTKIGDSVEVNGLKLAFSDLMNGETVGSPSGWCGLGSVKSNIGHLESASGMASVFKVLLAMQHATLPATLHLQQLSDYIQLEETPFRIVDKQQPWSLLADRNGASLPRRAGVSGFGFGGGNAHIVLEQYTAQTMTESQGDYLFVLSAHSAEQLQTQALNLLHWIRQTGQNVSPAAIAWTLQRGREETGYRLAVSADQLEQLAAKLQRFTIQKQGSKGIHMGRVESGGEQTSLRLDGEAGRAFLEVSVKTRELDKLAGLWVQGVEIDWRLLYPGGIPTPVSLPGYPFARQSHWIADIREEPQPETAAEEDIPDEQLSMWYEQRNEEGERMPAFLQLLKIKG